MLGWRQSRVEDDIKVVHKAHTCSQADESSENGPVQEATCRDGDDHLHRLGRMQI